MPRLTTKMPTKRQIAAVWMSDAHPSNFIPLEWGQTIEECLCCWRCGHKKGIERAHIKADCHGGDVDATNLVLLCHSCHECQPDGLDRETQIDWIRRGESQREIDARCQLLFAMAGTTVERFVEQFGVKSLDVFNRLAEQSIAVSAGLSNANGNLAALIRATMLEQAR